VLSTGCPDRYRNKVQYPVGKDWKIGFFAEHSHDIVEVSDCLAQDESFTEILDEIVRFGKEKKIPPYDFESGKGLVRHIYLRKGRGCGDIMVCLVINGKTMREAPELAKILVSRFPAIKSVILNINEKRTNVILGDKNITVYGSDTIEDIFCGLKVKISPKSFYQVNRECAELICKKAAELADLKPSEKLVDLFCGIGTIGLSMIKDYPESSLIGVEIIPDAVENAKENAALNHMKNTNFICGDANSPEISEADIIVVDPPRKGCASELIKRIAEISPSRVIYVSCNPDTLARDCKLFDAEGYKVTRAFAADMFSRTGHVESVVCLTRK
jgi:23S rRNA (uracil1939-C5)-methyltransferase